MKARASANGLTVQVIGGTHSIIVAMDLTEERRKGCLGFSVNRIALSEGKSEASPEQQQGVWLENYFDFSKRASVATPSDKAPFQLFRIVDSPVKPGCTYQYTVVPQYGKPESLNAGPTVTLRVTTEDPHHPNTAVFFNHGAGTDSAFARSFGDHPLKELPHDEQQRAHAWLSRGLEEAILDFLAQAEGSGDALHVAMYEFNKPNLLEALKAAVDRGVEVRLVLPSIVDEKKGGAYAENTATVRTAVFAGVDATRKVGSQSRLMHNKFVVLLKKGAPRAVWTGSTNWTDAAIYDQLNLGQGIYEPEVAVKYEDYFQLLRQDSSGAEFRTANAQLSALPDQLPPGQGTWPMFFPQKDEKILDHFASICRSSRHLFILNAFEPAPQIQEAIEANNNVGSLQFMVLGDAKRRGAVNLGEGSNVRQAVTMPAAARDPVPVKASFIGADLLSQNPIIVIGSSHFSAKSITGNYENCVIIRGNTALADIYLTEFMRLFSKYRFESSIAEASEGVYVGLVPNDSWSLPYYEVMSRGASERHLFAGTQAAIPSLIPIASLSEVPLSAPVAEAVQHTKALASGPQRAVPISAALLLYGLLSIEEEASHDDVLAWFRRNATSYSGYQTGRSEYLSSLGISESKTFRIAPESGARVSGYMTPGFLQIFQRAYTLARQSNAAEVQMPHLVGALLARENLAGPDSPEQQLTRFGMELPVLRRQAYVLLRRRNSKLARLCEESLLGPTQEIEEPSGFETDSPFGIDLLHIQREVNAFARLISARTVQPPLSIGLFGEWGSGKTFFMREMQKAVRKLAETAQEQGKEGKMQRDLPYYKRIAQIEFNAWHYVQGNLWASLMQRIFDQLNVHGDQKATSDQLRQHLITELGYRNEAIDQAAKEKERADNEVIEVTSELEAARTELTNKANLLATQYSKRDLRVFFFEPLKKDFMQLVSDLGLSSTIEGGRDMQAALAEAQAVFEQGHAILLPLARAKDRSKRWVSLFLGLAAVPLVALLLGSIPALLDKKALSDLTALSGGVGTFLVAGAIWLRRQVQWVSEKLKTVRDIQRKYDQNVADELAAITKAIQRLEEEQTRRQIQLFAKETQLQDAQRRAAEAKAKLEQAKVTNLLADFIRDRADSTDYRKHLGLLALVRQDFEKLSDLMEEENFYLAPPTDFDSQSRFKPEGKYRTLKEEEEEAGNRINRIILYIDDLDRCPPNKVVDVLQAVHLLLAFPLFVVVVGVDARWITRSLTTQHQQLFFEDREPAVGSETLAEQNASLADLERSRIYGSASPRDYLEKIFQIPFWLRPMSVSATTDMIDGLLGVREAATKGPNHAPSEGGQSSESETARLIAKEAHGEGGRVVDAVRPTNQTSQARPSEEQSSRAPESPQVAVKPEQDIAEIMQITPKEREFMRELAPLLNRSPRSLKRFINIYRLIRARQTRNELIAFLTESERVSDYQTVLFMLAVDVGVPGIAPIIFDKINETTSSSKDKRYARRQETTGPSAHRKRERSADVIAAKHEPPLIKDLDSLIDAIDRDENIKDDLEWTLLRAWLVPGEPSGGSPAESKAPRKLRLPFEVASLAAWVPVVSRYSFRSTIYRGEYA